MAETRKVNGGDPGEIARTMLGVSEPEPARRQTVFGALKKYGGIITTVIGFVVTIYWVGSWGGRVTTLQESQAKEIGEIKMQVAGLAEDIKRMNQDRIEDTRQTSYTRAQLEVVGKQLSGIEATLRERKTR